MKICVCIKQVPDTTEVKLDPKTHTLIRDGIPNIINRDDKSGVEAALALREKVGGTVTVVCMGPPQAEVALREALAMGCDEAYLLSDRKFGGSDTYATATVIGAGLTHMGYDLVITGRQAIDGDTAQVGPQIAEQLKIPQVSYAAGIEVEEDGSLLVKRQVEDRAYYFRVKTPCLLTAISELATPRYMSVRGIVEAYEKEIKVLTFEDLKGYMNPDYIGLYGSPTNVVVSFTKEAKGVGTMVKGSVDECVKAIMDKLEQKHII